MPLPTRRGGCIMVRRARRPGSFLARSFFVGRPGMATTKAGEALEAPGAGPGPAEDLNGSAFHSRDMAPTTPAERRWGMKDIAALWVSMSACITTYTLASSLIAEGMNWWQAVLTI